jgi:hydrogenase nickel incorporation protein HypA/HybF
MHELSLTGAVVNTALKHADGRAVSTINLRVGTLRQVVPDTLQFYFQFQFVARGTLCEGARLQLEVIAAALRCESCRREWEIEIPAFRCALCGGADVAITRGEEFEVESIEVESIDAEEDACIAQK